jgi:hypothetical protein
MKVCVGLLIVMFCQSEKPVTVSEFCQVSSLIRVEKGESRKLSLETNRQIAKHNRKVHQLCDRPEQRK